MAKLQIGINDLATLNPILAQEWHPTKNGGLSPKDICGHSGKKVWWLGKCGHEWMATVDSRNRHNHSNGCPICSGRAVLKGFNDLATICPELASEWHPTKNKDLTPESITKWSDKKVWWLGKCGHIWSATVSNRMQGRGCPCCSSELHTSFAEQAIYFFVKMCFPDTISRDNSLGKELDIYIPSLRCGIEYDSAIYHHNIGKDKSKNTWCLQHNIRLIRIRERNCPALSGADVIIRERNDDDSLNMVISKLMVLLCAKDIHIDVNEHRYHILDTYISYQRLNSFAAAHPELVCEWHTTKNGSLTPDMFSPQSNKMMWWQCKNGHEWKALISNRSNGHGCPYCAGLQASAGTNDLLTVNPKLADEWHPTKNGSLQPSDVLPQSSIKVWWLGKCGHEWQAVIYSRHNGNGCPYCGRKRLLIGFNDLLTENPTIASEWNYKKNSPLQPFDVMSGSDRKVWWLGKCGHEWQAAVDSRVRGLGCPYCSGKRTLKGFNDLGTTHPDLAKEWHPTKNDFTPQNITAGSNRTVWWICQKGHEWSAVVSSRVRGNGCPVCAGKVIITGENDFETLYPEIAKLWNYEKNGDLLPSMVLPFSEKNSCF